MVSFVQLNEKGYFRRSYNQMETRQVLIRKLTKVIIYSSTTKDALTREKKCPMYDF